MGEGQVMGTSYDRGRERASLDGFFKRSGLFGIAFSGWWMDFKKVKPEKWETN